MQQGKLLTVTLPSHIGLPVQVLATLQLIQLLIADPGKERNDDPNGLAAATHTGNQEFQSPIFIPIQYQHLQAFGSEPPEDESLSFSLPSPPPQLIYK